MTTKEKLKELEERIKNLEAKNNLVTLNIPLKYEENGTCSTYNENQIKKNKITS